MAIREYQFDNGVETSAAPTGGDPSVSGDLVNLGYANTNYAYKSSWYDKQADNTSIRGISASNRANGQIVFNYGTSTFYHFDSGSSAADDDDLVLQPSSGTGRWLKISTSGSGSGDTLVQQLDSYDAGILAGEALTDRDAVCMELHNGSGSNVYRYFKCDADLANRRSFVGFTKSSVSVTPNIKTYTISAAYVTGNSIPITINGRTYTVSYASSSDATLQSLATAIATDPDVTSASVTVVGGNQTGTDDRVITITSKGGLTLNITGTTVTGGASQPTVTIGTTQAAVGNAVDLHEFGPLNGFTSLTPGAAYYISGTAGALTINPSEINPVFVGRALSSTVMFVDPSNRFASLMGSNQILVRSHGISSSTFPGSGTQTVEHFDFTGWAAGTSATAGGYSASTCGETSFQGGHHVIDAITTSSTVVKENQKYNKVSWADQTDRTNGASVYKAIVPFNGFLMVAGGLTDFTNGATAVTTKDHWNGATWANGTAIGVALYRTGGFFHAGDNEAHFGPGTNTSNSKVATHESFNTSDVKATETNFPASAGVNVGSASVQGYGFISASTDNGYTWNGTSWSSAFAVATSFNDTNGDVSVGAGYASSNGRVWINGGLDGTGAPGNPIATTQSFNGSAYANSTSSSTSRAYSMGAVL